ncbi:hypothetical protein B0181_05790 [Moraxella caviae]|uniref:Surface antigen n=2 Tax=Moraxella caviae TaxID=34060 RepID=A0A1T0A3K2_9GAMM|nr:hypothetical protein [Moraxella caviae]OOR89921.1 hypothetical protein B0181_05790 [Moraxella caviae]STZ14304.1 Uncharacterised protein [Moraxella caviae]VEW12240.1 Uncharacterised protein [Moraxella caviae]
MKTKVMALGMAVAMSLAAMESQASFWDKVGQGLGVVNKTLGVITGNTATTESHRSDKVFARASDTQLEQIAKVVQTRTGRADIDQTLNEAQDNIFEMILKASCSDNWRLNFGRIQSPEEEWLSRDGVGSKMVHHPKDRCATVQSMGSFAKPAKNIIEFKIIYASDISGEANSCKAKLRDQYGTGEWLVSEHFCTWN